MRPRTPRRPATRPRPEPDRPLRRGRRPARHRAAIPLALLLASITPLPIAAQAAPLVHADAAPGSHSFVLLLEPPPRLAWGPTQDRADGAIITAARGVLDVPTGALRFASPLPGIADIIVAQHDPSTIWIVAHTRRPLPAPDITRTPSALVIAFTSPEPAATLPRAPASPSHPRPPTHPSPAPARNTLAPQEPRLTIRWDGIPLGQAAAALSALAHVPITLARGANPSQPVSLHVTNATLRDTVLLLAAAAHCRPVPHGQGFALVPLP